MPVDERLNELESRLLFNEDGIQSLSDLIYAQQRQLDKLQQTCDLLVQRIQEAGQEAPAKIVDEPPPHY